MRINVSINNQATVSTFLCPRVFDIRISRDFAVLEITGGDL